MDVSWPISAAYASLVSSLINCQLNAVRLLRWNRAFCIANEIFSCTSLHRSLFGMVARRPAARNKGHLPRGMYKCRSIALYANGKQCNRFFLTEWPEVNVTRVAFTKNHCEWEVKQIFNILIAVYMNRVIWTMERMYSLTFRGQIIHSTAKRGPCGIRFMHRPSEISNF